MFKLTTAILVCLSTASCSLLSLIKKPEPVTITQYVVPPTYLTQKVIPAYPQVMANYNSLSCQAKIAALQPYVLELLTTIGIANKQFTDLQTWTMEHRSSK